MNERLTWEMISNMVVYICSHLLILFTACSYFRKRQPRRKVLLAGGLIMAATGSFWVYVSLSWAFSGQPLFDVLDNLRWVDAIGSLLFYATLLLIAMQRRNQAQRVAELEAILQEREAIAKSSQAAAP